MATEKRTYTREFKLDAVRLYESTSRAGRPTAARGCMLSCWPETSRPGCIGSPA
jgi:hypothetical protein